MNTKQRNRLEQLSREIDEKLNKLDYKTVTRNIKNERKKYKRINFNK